MKQFSDACERNREPILAVLRRVFGDRTAVLEIGSRPGQHAAYFAPALPHLAWPPGDIADKLPCLRLWRAEAQKPRPPEAVPLRDGPPLPPLEPEPRLFAQT